MRSFEEFQQEIQREIDLFNSEKHMTTNGFFQIELKATYRTDGEGCHDAKLFYRWVGAQTDFHRNKGYYIITQNRANIAFGTLSLWKDGEIKYCYSDIKILFKIIKLLK